jgi:hypothetical protein
VVTRRSYNVDEEWRRNTTNNDAQLSVRRISMARLLLPAALIVLAMISGCSLIPAVGSGRYVDKTYELADFTHVEVSSAFQYQITRGDTFSVTVRIDDNLVDRLQVEKRGDTLHVGFRPGAIRNSRAELTVTMPFLEGVEGSGAVSGTIAGFKSDRPFDLRLSGASRLSGDLEAGDLQTQLSGASNAQLTGKVGNMRIEVSGASGVDFFDLAGRDADVRASGASHANVNASGALTGDVSGASRLRYTGNPTLGRVNSSGASSVAAR